MKVRLANEVRYHGIDDRWVVLPAGTEVLVDLRDGTACHDGDWFDIAPCEFQMDDALDRTA